MIQLCVLASGSRGNSVYFNVNGCECLVDAGLSLKALERRLSAIGTSASRLRHVFVTHEHEDHISGLFQLVRRFPVQIHLSHAVYLMLGSRLPSTRVTLFEQTYEVDGIEVTPFSVMHDAADPVAFTFRSHSTKFGVVTDTGYVSNLISRHVQDCRVLILEANHDEHRLWNGTYPWPLKQRIAGRLGHLSNRQAGDCLKTAWHPGLETVILAHLSEENNHPDMALHAVEEALRSVTAAPPRLIAAGQHQTTETVTIP